MKYQWKHTSFPQRLRAGDEMNRLHGLSSDWTTLIVSCAQSNPARPPGVSDKGSLDSDPGKQLLPWLREGTHKRYTRGVSPPKGSPGFWGDRGKRHEA